MASSSWKSAASLAMWNVLKYNLPCPYLPAGRLILLGKVDEPSFYITDFPPPSPRRSPKRYGAPATCPFLWGEGKSGGAEGEPDLRHQVLQILVSLFHPLTFGNGTKNYLVFKRARNNLNNQVGSTPET